MADPKGQLIVTINGEKRITIHLDGENTWLEYHPISPEDQIEDQRLAVEMGLQALAIEAVRRSDQENIPVPDVVRELAETELWREHLGKPPL
jgi:hypothetical protein